MKPEEKTLLLQDLCARLPYGVIGLYTWKNKKSYNRELTGGLYDELKSSWNSTEDSQFSPYLRPMSSMTEEEYREFLNTQGWECGESSHPKYEYTYKTFDWLNSKLFDYRGLIEKGLALEAPEGMYND